MSISINGTNGLTFNDGSSQQTAASGFGFKNRILNGDMRIDQRNAGASVAMTGGIYITDRWRSYASAASKLTAQQSTTAPAGFTHSLLFTSQSAYTQAAGDEFMIEQRIEGFNVADFAWGTASAAAITINFQVRCSVTGTFSGVVANSAADRNYPFTFTINSANTFETKSVTIPGDTSGTWFKDNGIGLRVKFNLGTGSTYLQTAGAWTSSYANGATGSIALVNTNGATFYITGVQLEKGSTATSFDYRPYGTELALCQRYFWKCSDGGFSGVFGGGPNALLSIPYPSPMRTSPTLTYVSGGAMNNNSGTYPNITGFTTSLNIGVYQAACQITLSSNGVGGNGGVTYGMVFTASSEL